MQTGSVEGQLLCKFYIGRQTLCHGAKPGYWEPTYHMVGHWWVMCSELFVAGLAERLMADPGKLVTMK
jgi:hypothetical protein